MKNDDITISIIVPVLNEEEQIGKLISHLKEKSSTDSIVEIMVVDGGSYDKTVQIALSLGATVFHTVKGRAKQMNLGANQAKGDILYFLHADTFPPKGFDQLILSTISKEHESGCFQMRFDSKHWLLRFFSWLTKYNHIICRGGDQSLFVTKVLFFKTKGFNEDYIVFEDNEFIGRLYQNTRFKIIPHKVETSARKYRQHGILRLQYHFGVIHLKYYLGAGPEQLYNYYKRKIAV